MDRVWVNSGSWWWTGRPGVLWFMGSQRVGHNWATELNWTDVVNWCVLQVLVSSQVTGWLGSVISRSSFKCQGSSPGPHLQGKGCHMATLESSVTPTPGHTTLPHHRELEFEQVAGAQKEVADGFIQGTQFLWRADGPTQSQETKMYQSPLLITCTENHSCHHTEDPALFPSHPSLPHTEPTQGTLSPSSFPGWLLLETKVWSGGCLASMRVSMTGRAPWSSRVLLSEPLFPPTLAARHALVKFLWKFPFFVLLAASPISDYSGSC